MKKPKISFSTYISVAVASLLSVLGIGTVLFHTLEDWTWIQSFYFAVVTISTVGYGDLTPSNDLSRLVTAIFILLGVTITVAAIGVIGNAYLRRKSHKLVK